MSILYKNNTQTNDSIELQITAYQIARVFVMLEAINFAKMRNEFESLSTFERIAAGQNALEVALKITGLIVPPMAIAASDLEILMPVLNVIAQVAVHGAPSPFPGSRPLHYDPVTGQFLGSDVGPDQTGAGTDAFRVRQVNF